MLQNLQKTQLQMDKSMVDVISIQSAWFTSNDKLCVKFSSDKDILALNNHKFNLRESDTIEEFIPQAVQELEIFLICW